jgi:transcriptional antiterminator RfaH
MDHAPKACHPSAPETSATNALNWYLIHTKPRQEVLALTNLSRQGFECYMPMLKLEKIRQRKAALVTEPLFPRYLFIRLDTGRFGQSWSPIRSTLGVNQLVRFGGQPAKVDKQLVNQLFWREQGAVAHPLFAAGENVIIADGPFAGLEAIYQNTDAESRSMVLLNILSKPVSMMIDIASLRRAG